MYLRSQSSPQPGTRPQWLLVLICGFAMAMTACNNTDNANTANAGADAEATENNEEATMPSDPNKVLRHAVFFRFKDESTPAQVQEVVDAFAALPEKIEEIIDFEWGTNNSPEGLDGGFTHCFLLTFANAEGRAVYLPHEEHKAFGDVLRPHMADVFVIDYWGDKNAPTLDTTLRHAVFFNLARDAEVVEEAFAALPDKIDTIKAFEWGTNNSPEKHDDGFTHCFLVTFDSDEGRAAYLPHDAHQAFVEVLKPSLAENGVRVLDWFAQ